MSLTKFVVKIRKKLPGYATVKGENEKANTIELAWTGVRQNESASNPMRSMSDRRKIVSVVLKFSIAYLLIAGVQTFFGGLYYPASINPMVIGLAAVLLPFFVVYSVTGRRRSKIFRFVVPVFSVASVSFLVMAYYNYLNWQRCLNYCFVHRTFGLNYFNAMGVDICTAFFLLIVLKYISHDGGSLKCPSCGMRWAKILMKNEGTARHEDSRTPADRSPVNDNSGGQRSGVDLPVTSLAIGATNREYFRCKFCNNEWSQYAENH